MVQSLLVALAFAATAASSTPRVALVYSDFGNYRHRDDYDTTFEHLRWRVEEFENTEFEELARSLESFDLVLCGALYNYGNPQDLARFAPSLRAFLRRGGGLIITDANYGPHVDWLASVRPDLAAAAVGCQAQAGDVSLSAPCHPLLSYPHTWRPRPMWSHLDLGPGWRVLAADADGGAVLAVAGEGLGAIWLSSNWALPGDCLENAWEWLRMRRSGVEVTELRGMEELRPGLSRARLSLMSTDDEVRHVALAWHAALPGERAIGCRRQAQVGPRQVTPVEMALPITRRGLATTWFTLRSEGGVYESPRLERLVPELVAVSVLRPAYRGTVVLSEPQPRVVIAATVYPASEDTEDLVLEATVQIDGTPGRTVRVDLPSHYGASTEVAVPVDGITPGAFGIHLAALRGRAVVWRGSLSLQAVTGNRGVILGGGLDTRVHGEPFFPIGIYHVPLGSLAEARRMGFNCVQAWGGSPEEARASLDMAERHGMKVILEMSALVRGGLQPERLRRVVEAVRDHPALLCWYPVDEPNSGMLDDCVNAYRICYELGAGHPVYLVLCDPNLFGAYAEALDVLAIDPYPVPGAPVSMVAAWMRSAQDSTGAQRAVWLIPQLHNPAAYGGDPTQGRAPTAEEEWCMVFQGLVYGAKGIVYYPWDDGACGLVHEPPLLEALPRINAFLAEHGTSLAASQRVLVCGLGGITESADTHAALFSGARTLLLATNTAAEPRRIALDLPSTTGRSLLDERHWVLTGGTLEVELAPLEVLAIELR